MRTTHKLQTAIAFAALSLASAASADNFAECLLEKLPGVQSHPAANAAFQICRGEHPSQWTSVEQGSGRGLFAAYDSGDECTLEVSRSTPQHWAVMLMRRSCNLLYDKPAFDPARAVLDDSQPLDSGKPAEPAQAPPVETPRPSAPVQYQQQRPMTSEMVDAILGNSAPECEIKPVMSNSDYVACGSTPPGQ